MELHLLGSTAATLSDLVESKAKSKVGIKDSGIYYRVTVEYLIDLTLFYCRHPLLLSLYIFDVNETTQRRLFDFIQLVYCLARYTLV